MAAGHPLRSQFDLVRSSPPFRALFSSTLVSGLGTWLAVIALTVDVFDRTHSAKWVSGLLIADFLPAVAIGLFLSPLVDRISRKLLLVGADVVRFAVFVALPFADSPLRIVVLAGVAGLANGFARPAAYAGLPNLVDEEDLPNANSLLRTTENLTTLAGTLLGGVIAASAGPHTAYWLNAGSFALSLFFVVQLPGRKLRAAPVASRGHIRDIADGLALVRGSRPLLAVFFGWGLMAFANGLINVAEVALAKVSFHAGDIGFGLMWTASGVGLAIGSFFAVSWLDRRGMGAVYVFAFLLMAVGFAAAAGSPNVWVALWCLILAGVGNGAAVVYNSLLVQRGSPDHLRGRAFTVLMSTYFAVLGGGMIAAGPLTDHLGARWTWGIAASVGIVASVTAWVFVRRLEEPARVPVPAAN